MTTTRMPVISDAVLGVISTLSALFAILAGLADFIPSKSAALIGIAVVGALVSTNFLTTHALIRRHARWARARLVITLPLCALFLLYVWQNVMVFAYAQL